jgi:hypothetical protein
MAGPATVTHRIRLRFTAEYGDRAFCLGTRLNSPAARGDKRKADRCSARRGVTVDAPASCLRRGLGIPKHVKRHQSPVSFEVPEGPTIAGRSVLDRRPHLVD